MTALLDRPRVIEPAPDRTTTTRREVALYSLAVVSAVTAVIHFAVSGEHFAEYWAFGAFMLASAWLQVLWTVGAVLRPVRLLLIAGAVLNAGIVVTYIVTRTYGDVVGPTPHEAEQVGFGDALCTVLEAGVAIGCLWLLISPLSGRLPRVRLAQITAATGVVTAVLLSVALLDGGPEMVMSMDDSDAPTAAIPMAGTPGMPGMPGMPAAGAVSLATTTPAGNITMPSPTMQMAPGMQMAGPMCSTAPTAAQQAATVSLVDTSWQASSKYQSLSVAKAAGYRAITPSGQAIVHYLNPAYYGATIRGGPVLDTAQPQSLVYANTPRGAVLAAAMYIMSPFGGGTPPQPGGCLTQWHVHTNLCLNRTGVVGETNPSCPAGSFNVVTPPMLHVWFVPIPGGPTAVDAPDAQVVHAAQSVPTPHNASA
jgi:hypothetical protein